MLTPSERSLAAAMISEQFGEHSCGQCHIRLATGIFEVYNVEDTNISQLQRLCAVCAFGVKGRLLAIQLIKTIH